MLLFFLYFFLRSKIYASFPFLNFRFFSVLRISNPQLLNLLSSKFRQDITMYACNTAFTLTLFYNFFYIFNYILIKDIDLSKVYTNLCDVKLKILRNSSASIFYKHFKLDLFKSLTVFRS